MADLPGFNGIRIGVVGLGYVGLPLAVYMARAFPVIGFNIDAKRITELSEGRDGTREVTGEEFAHAAQLSFTTDPSELKSCNFHSVSVPTPIDEASRPDLTAMKRASETAGSQFSPGTDIDALSVAVGFRPATLVKVGIDRFIDWYCGYFNL